MMPHGKIIPLESVFGCYDILAMIFDHLAPSRFVEAEKTLRHECRKALASSAVACRTLSHHALNVLWRELDDLDPLLKILPNYDDSADDKYTIGGAISDEHWTRFQLYADRVRAILYPEPEFYYTHPHPSVWLFLAAKCRGSPLIPRLSELTICDLNNSTTSALALLFSTTLRMLNMMFSLSDEGHTGVARRVALSLFQTLPLMAPDLESLEYALDIGLDREYMKSFQRLTRLRKLSIGFETPVDEYALGVLSSIPALRDLSCSISLPSSSAFSRPCYTLQRLTSLLLHGHFDSLTAFTQACKLPNLARIALRIQKSPSTGELVDSFAAICRHCNPALLTSFSVGFVNLLAQLHSAGCLLQYLEPLLALSNIKFFHLNFCYKFMPSIRDDDLARIGKAWPQLLSFRVSSVAGISWFSESGVSKPTLFGLVDLARCCRHLDVFQVPELDVKVIPSEKDVALPLGHCLRSFSSRDAVLPSPDSPAYTEAATILNRTFPSIDFDGAQSEARSNAKEWKAFLGLLKTMRVRPEEGGL